MENAKIKNMYDLSQSIAGEYLSQFTYPWEALKGISDFIKKLGPTLDPEIYEKRGENIWVAKSATVAPTACLNGPLIIDEDAEIRHCAFIRGSAIIGKGSVVGNSTEIKNDIIFNTVQVPHYNYVGDSILGYKSHMGAGSITSNVKSDKTLVVVKDSRDSGEEIETGLKKFGAMLGDHVEVGCNSVLNPGTVICPNCNVYPLSSVRGHFLTNVLVRALPAGLTDFIVVSGLVIFCREFQVDLDCLSTSCTILVAIVGFMILHRIARPMNTGHIVMLVGVIAGWILCMLFGRSFFGITEISKQCEMLMIIFAIITEPVLRYLSLIVEWISARCRMIHARFSRA